MNSNPAGRAANTRTKLMLKELKWTSPEGRIRPYKTLNRKENTLDQNCLSCKVPMSERCTVMLKRCTCQKCANVNKVHMSEVCQCQQGARQKCANVNKVHMSEVCQCQQGAHVRNVPMSTGCTCQKVAHVRKALMSDRCAERACIVTKVVCMRDCALSQTSVHLLILASIVHCFCKTFYRIHKTFVKFW